MIRFSWVFNAERAMGKPRDERQKDLFRPALDRIIDLDHALARLAGLIDWDFLDTRFSAVCSAGPGQPPLPSRLVAGLFILKHMHNLSDEVLCARWVENPYYQFFCGEETFQHAAPFDRSSLTRWRQRLGEEHLVALIQESLSVAHKTGAIATKDLERVVVDTTVQPKAIAHPTDARLMHDRQTRRFRQAQRCPLTSELSAPGQARRDHGRPLHPRPSIQARPASAQVPAHPSRAASSATSAARSTAIPSCRAAAARCSILPCVSASRTTASVAPRSMRCTRPRSNASARARRGLPMSSDARSRWRRRRPSPGAASLSSMPKRCTAILSVATPSGRSSPIWSG